VEDVNNLSKSGLKYWWTLVVEDPTADHAISIGKLRGQALQGRKTEG
jgi:hypothetical protein